MGMLINSYAFAAPAATGFGYETGDGTGTTDFAIFDSDHDSFQYTNGTGADIAVTKIQLIQITGIQSSATATVKAALYADNGSNAPGALLAQSGSLTLTHHVETEATFTLGSSVNVTSGTKVWVAFDTNNGVLFSGALRADDGRYRWKSRPGGGTFSDPFGSTSTFTGIIPARLRP